MQVQTKVLWFPKVVVIRKGQICWLAKGEAVGHREFIRSLFGIAA
jgi:hypothetical protein